MAQIELIAEPAKLFALINQVAEKHNLQIIFQRFKTEKQEAGWKVIPLNESSPAAYSAFGGEEIYLSAEMAPRHEQDWQFTKTAAEQLINITGCRQMGEELELTVIRLFHKKSAVKKVFDTFKKLIIASFKKDEIYLNGQPYNNIFSDPEIWKYKVYYTFDNRLVRITKTRG
jgi:hypothetical protein